MLENQIQQRKYERNVKTCERIRCNKENVKCKINVKCEKIRCNKENVKCERNVKTCQMWKK